MKKIITAIGDEKINNELKREENIKVMLNDIQYKEGIIEILEEGIEVDYIVINDNIQGNIKLEELIKQIYIINRDIKLIIIVEDNNKDIDEYLNSKNIYKIIIKDKTSKISLNEILNVINNCYIEIKKEDITNKNLISKSNNINKNNGKIKIDIENYINNKKEKIHIIKNKINNLIINRKKNKNINLNSENDIKNKNKVICITGPPGVGKTIISINLAKVNIYKNNKILIIDSDYFNNSINKILSVKVSKKEIKKNLNYNFDNNLNKNIIKDFNILKINKKIDLLTCNDKWEKNNNYSFSVNLNCIINNLNYIKALYNLIIIDTNCNEGIENLKNTIEISDICLFVSDTNLLEINKSVRLLEKIINNFNIEISKINILFNKYNSESINFNLLKKIFSEFKTVGKLNYNEKYNKLINKNNKYNLINKKIRTEYLNINNKLKR